MTAPRLRYKVEDLALGRVHEGEAEVGVLIVDGALILAADPSRAFDQIVDAIAELKLRLPKGSQRAAAAHRFAAYGRHAVNGERRASRAHDAVMTGSAMLSVVAETLGADAADKVRRAAAERMGCR